MFAHRVIVAYPTDTSYGLGVRADDAETLDRLYDIKKRPANKYCSLMVKDWDMLNEFAEIPAGLDEAFFVDEPRTVILRPKSKLPKSPYWPDRAVGFRIATNPAVAESIDYPVTATSANLSGQPNIYDPQEILKQWGSCVCLFTSKPKLDKSISPSEIWDYTDSKTPKKVR